MCSFPNFVKEILFIDIETVSCAAAYDDLSDFQQVAWNKKAAFLGVVEPEVVKQLFFEKAGIYAEFGKVIVIGMGFISIDVVGELTLRICTLRDHDEKSLLEEFSTLLQEKFNFPTLKLCAHNGKEFDFPYLCRRMLINSLSLPTVLNLSGKKPWEVSHLDTMEMWKFGDRKNFTSLEMLACLFGIPSSKSLMQGSQVNDWYYNHHDLNTIANYCAQDVVVLTQIFLKLNNLQTINETNVIFV